MHIMKDKCEKAPGESGVTPEAYKVMLMESKTILLKILCNVYKGRTDPDEWHEALVKCLQKKGNTSDPNNWRAICLKDMSARLMSGIMNARPIQVIQEHGVKTQFGSQPGLGCLDGLYTLWSALTTRRYHNQPTWALFVNLVKAFDTVNHELLFKLLEQYGVPKDVASMMKRMYESMFVKLKVGKEERCIPYSVGVQQGHNMAPLLFLFSIQAFGEILEKKLIDEWRTESPEYNPMILLLTTTVDRYRQFVHSKMRTRNEKMRKIVTKNHQIHPPPTANATETRSSLHPIIQTTS